MVSSHHIPSARTIVRGSLSGTVRTLARLLLRRQGLNIPDHIRILLDAPIAREETHAAHAADTLADPLVLILVRLVYQCLRLDVACKVIAHKVVIPIESDGIAESVETTGVAKGVGPNRVKDTGEIRV